jgi:cytochrome P450
VIIEVTKRLVAFDEASMRIIRHNANGENGDGGLMPETHDMIASVLGPGPTLNGMSGVQLEKMAGMLNEIDRTVAVRLQAWVREIFSVSNAYAIYGPENLFAMHPELVKSFWEYEEGMVSLLADVFPAITARKPYLARKKILDVLVEFVEKARYRKASPLIQQRVSINLKHGLTKKMAGHAELIMLFGIMGNAVPTTFWLLANIFSRPELLEELRCEASKAVTQEGGKRIINVAMLRSSCPLLVSTYRETLRTCANLSSVRLVLEDTMVADKYLLKKNSIVQIASGVIHVDKDVWGTDADNFNPRRFIQASSTSTADAPTEKSSNTPASLEEKTAAPLPKNVPSAAYRAFGGGSVICPGRHFAQSEIVGFAAAVLLGFDITSPSGQTLSLPQKDDSRIPLTVMKPVQDRQVLIRRRKGMEKVTWELTL